MTLNLNRLLLTAGCAAAMGLASLATTPAIAQKAPEKIKIGYAVSLTGPFAGPASMLPVANYRLWVKDVNARGGLKVAGFDKPIPVEAIEYDDTSNPENAIRLTEKLMSDDKVDFALPPWGTAMNLAVAPIYKKNNYPQLGATAVINNAEAMTKRFDTLFLFSSNASDYATAIVSLLSKLKSEGKINNKVVLLSVADQFGADLNAAGSKAFKEAGFEVVLNKTYPMASRDLSAEIKQAQDSGADSFVAFSYPPDTFMIAAQAQTLNYNPKVYYTAVGTAFPAFKAKMGAKAEGILGAGGWDRTSPGAQAYFDAFKAMTNHEPDRWGAPITYASLQALEQAVAKVGLDRKKVADELRTGTFNTIAGKLKFTNQIQREQPLVSQWQGTDYVTVRPANLPGAKDAILPKPNW
jgi:branched-chain amino acid transport system substrate-binding protein